MAYDEALAHSIRELLADEPGVAETKMFGGLAFLVHGNMAIAASRDGGVLVRVGPAQADRLVASTTAEVAVLAGRVMSGWLSVPAIDVRTMRQVAKWVTLGAGYARTLAPKT